jgi:hypothetical protein
MTYLGHLVHTKNAQVEHMSRSQPVSKRPRRGAQERSTHTNVQTIHIRMT